MKRTFYSLLAPLLVMALFVPSSAHAQDGDVTLGTPLPLADRPLQSSNGGTQRLADLGGSSGLVLVFWSNNCRWVDSYEDRLAASIDRFSQQGYNFVLINSNDPVAFPEESIDAIRDRADQRRYSAPYLLDEGSQLAVALGATRTPHVFVFDGASALVYSGTIDDSPGDPDNVSESYLDSVLTAMSTGDRAPVSRTVSYGCRIKLVE